MTEKKTWVSARRRRVIVGILACLLVAAATAWGQEKLVSCRYLKAEGKTIQLELSIGRPAPSTVIVIQNLPSGARIVGASPPVKRFDPQSGEAKWLLKGVRSGELLVQMELSRPIRARELRGQIRYKHPATGAMVAERIAP
jgi:hypothetical protein